MSTTGRLIIITGGTGGLGKALAKHYVEIGDQVVITSRDENRMKAIQTEWNHPKALYTYKLDVTDNEAVRAFAAWIKIRFDRCDILFNNAGTASFKAFTDMSLQEIHDMINTNINGLLYITRAFLPFMQQADHGQIVNIASLAGRVATAKASVYAASKAAVILFSEGIRHELQGSGIDVTCVLPGPIDTPFLDHADETGKYRHSVRRYLLAPEKTAALIARGVEAKKAEIIMPKRLQVMSILYQLLPYKIKNWIAPLMNRK